MVTWEPWSAPQGEIHTALQPEISLQRIVDGAHDGYLRNYARTVAAYGQPVLLRLAHEMNGTWYPWGVHVNGNTPALYVQAWRHVHRIFDAAGADNVSWVWSINNLEGRPGENDDIAEYYPGPRWVDWVSTSGFNWGEAYSWSSWRAADALYGGTYAALSTFGKPIMITEIGTTGSGGDPYSWIGQTQATPAHELSPAARGGLLRRHRRRRARLPPARPHRPRHRPAGGAGTRLAPALAHQEPVAPLRRLARQAPRTTMSPAVTSTVIDRVARGSSRTPLRWTSPLRVVASRR